MSEKMYVVREGDVVEKFYADFLHIKDGIPCLYKEVPGGLPYIIAAFSRDVTVYQEE